MVARGLSRRAGRSDRPRRDRPTAAPAAGYDEDDDDDHVDPRSRAGRPGSHSGTRLKASPPSTTSASPGPTAAERLEDRTGDAAHSRMMLFSVAGRRRRHPARLACGHARTASPSRRTDAPGRAASGMEPVAGSTRVASRSRPGCLRPRSQRAPGSRPPWARSGRPRRRPCRPAPRTIELPRPDPQRDLGTARQLLVQPGRAAGRSSAVDLELGPPVVTEALSSAAIRFICGVPMKLATNTLAGLAKTSCGVAICSIRPSRMMAMRSAMVSASSWSWVTITVALERPGSTSLIWPRIGLAQLDVEARQRLVEEEAVGIADDGAAHRDALLLALGELARQAVEDVGRGAGCRATSATRLARSRPRRAARRAAERRCSRATVRGRIERVELEHHGDVALRGRQLVHALAGDDESPRGRALQPGDHAQGRRLAAARGAEQADDLAGGDRQVDVVDGRRSGRSAW